MEYIGEALFASKNRYLQYHSKATQCDCFFTESGDLRIFRSNISVEAYDLAAKREALRDEEFQKCVMDFASKCIQPYQIEELKLASVSSFAEGYFDCTLVEVYDGMETGTQVFAACMQDGTVVNAVITKGVVFEKVESERYSLIREIVIAPQEATDIAHSCAAEKILESGMKEDPEKTTCELKAYGDQQYYLVTICGMAAEVGFEYEQVFFVKIDVTDDSVLDMTWSQ